MYNYRIIIIMEYVGGGVDYNSGSYSIQFNIGVTKASFNISINDDNIMESNESFSLSINTQSLSNEVTVGDHGQTRVTILPNDRK